MAMEPIGFVLHAANLVLVILLLTVYAQNYRKMKSKYTVGLMIFAALFLVQTLMGITFDATMVMYSSQGAQMSATFLEAIKAVGFAVLLWISWD